MGLLDILKNKIPGFHVNIGTKTTNIQFTNSGVLVNGEEGGADLRKIILDFIGSKKKEKSYSNNIIHKDLLEDYRSLEEITIREGSSLKILKFVLPENRFEMILMARRVHMAIEKGVDSLKIRSLIDKLEKEFPRDGKKTLNLISANYFDSVIFPMIDFFKDQSLENYIKEFNDFFESILKFFPIAVFVNNDISDKKISEEIRVRLGLKVPLVKVHAIGNQNISKVERVLSKMRNEGLSIECYRSTTPRGFSAQTVVIKINKE